MARLRTRNVFSNDTLTVTAVESVELHADRSTRRHFLLGSLRPVAIVVETAEKTYALDTEGRPVDLDSIGPTEEPAPVD